jgi:hypothetical protein
VSFCSVEEIDHDGTHAADRFDLVIDHTGARSQPVDPVRGS